jgi:hypothetical protein
MPKVMVKMPKRLRLRTSSSRMPKPINKSPSAGGMASAVSQGLRKASSVGSMENGIGRWTAIRQALPQKYK